MFIPTDHAFQRWHPIDWGFYPFSVPEFTESVIINHFVRGKLKQDGIKNGQVMKTLGGREIVFKKNRRYFYFMSGIDVCKIYANEYEFRKYIYDDKYFFWLCMLKNYIKR